MIPPPRAVDRTGPQPVWWWPPGPDGRGSC